MQCGVYGIIPYVHPVYPYIVVPWVTNGARKSVLSQHAWHCVKDLQTGSRGPNKPGLDPSRFEQPKRFPKIQVSKPNQPVFIGLSTVSQRLAGDVLGGVQGSVNKTLVLAMPFPGFLHILRVFSCYTCPEDWGTSLRPRPEVCKL